MNLARVHLALEFMEDALRCIGGLTSKRLALSIQTQALVHHDRILTKGHLG